MASYWTQKTIFVDFTVSLFHAPSYLVIISWSGLMGLWLKQTPKHRDREGNRLLVIRMYNWCQNSDWGIWKKSCALCFLAASNLQMNCVLLYAE